MPKKKNAVNNNSIMTPITKVNFHNLFFSNEEETDFSVDFQKLDEDHASIIYQWIEKILATENVPGKNKESWIGKDEKDIVEAGIYKKSNAWHYHCGPTTVATGTVETEPHLPRNLHGTPSQESIHYFKISSDEITIFGFSNKHIPFLNEKSLPVGHSFRERIASPHDSTPHKLHSREVDQP